MKKALLCILVLLTVIFSSVITAYAYEIEPPYYVPEDKGEIAAVGTDTEAPYPAASVLTVPKIEIVTENGNGIQLLKADRKSVV